MAGWRRQNGEVKATGSNYRKPPLGSWQATVPTWEREFCALIGSVPWRRLLEAKKFMYLYNNVVQWNDSAGEEAFHNAKNRFWAGINGLPCDISLPDPDVYIDEIDWNSSIDPELLLDLEQEDMAPVVGDTEEVVVILSNDLLLDQSFACTGWGELEDGRKATGWGELEDERKATGWGELEDERKATGWGELEDERKATGWGELEDDRKVSNSGSGNGNWDCHANAYKNGNSWEDAQVDEASRVNGWGNSWNHWDDNACKHENRVVGRTGGAWAWNVNSKKREGTGWHMSRYKTSKFHGENNQMNRGWRNGRGMKRVNFAYEEPFLDKKYASSQRNSMNYCGPVSYHGNTRNSWGWENSFP